MLAVLVFVFFARPLTALPSYPAVILAFIFVFVAPGLIIANVLLPRAGLAVKTAAAPAVSICLMAAPGIAALEIHLALEDFALMYALTAATACGVAMLLSDQGSIRAKATPESETRGAEDGRGDVLLAGLIAVVLVGVVTTPFWASTSLAGDFDDWTYASYVREYIDTDRLNSEEPFFGTGEPVNPRMRTNVWVLSEALLADATDVSPLDLLQRFLPPVLTLFAVLAAYALSKTLFRSVTIGLLAAAILLGHGLLDMAPYEGLGRNLFLRISEDKMAGAFLLFPVALIFLIRAVRGGSTQAFLGFAFVVAALSVVHPMPLLYLFVTIAVLAVLQVIAERRLATLVAPGLLLATVALVSIWPFVQRELLVDIIPGLFLTEAGSQFRQEFRLVSLGGGWLVASHHLIMHPLVLLTIGLSPVFYLMSRRSAGARLVISLIVAAGLLMFVPVLATPLANVMAPSTLWRVPWIIPVAPLLGFMTYQASRQIAGAWRSSRLTFIPSLAPAAVVVLALAAVLAVQEQYLRWDDGAFYDRTSSSSVVPGTGGSIFLGGMDRAFSGNWRIKDQEILLLDHISAAVPLGSTVLVGTARLNLLMPAYLTHIYPTQSTTRTIYPQGSELTRQVAVEEQTFLAFYSGSLSRSELDEALERYGVDYVVVSLGTEADSTLREFAELGSENFEPAVGMPDLASREVGESKFKAWALDPEVQEQLVGTQVIVPEDVADGLGGIDVDIVVAPSAHIEGGGTVRLMLSFGEGSSPPLGNAFMEITFRSETDVGAFVGRRREISAEVVPGGRYFLTIARLADAPVDTYPADIWVLGASLKYRPPGIQEVKGTFYLLYEVRPS